MRKIKLLIFRLFLGIVGIGLILSSINPLYAETIKLHVFNEGEGLIRSVRELDSNSLGVAGEINYDPFFALVSVVGGELQAGTVRTNGGFWLSGAESIQPSQFDGQGNVTTVTIAGYRGVAVSATKGLLYEAELDGNVLWEKLYGETTVEFQYNHLSDHQFIGGDWVIVGSNTTVLGDKDVWLLKTDMAGNLLTGWPKSYGGNAHDYAKSFLEINSNYYLIGKTASYGPLESNMYVLKTDFNGNLMWDEDNNYGSYGLEYGRDMVDTDDGNLFIISTKYEEMKTKLGLVKADYNGQVLSGWPKILERGVSYAVFDIQKDTQGDIVTVGFAGNSGTGESDGLILIMTQEGLVRHERIIDIGNDGLGDDEFRSFELINEGIFVGGYTRTDHMEPWHPLVLLYQPDQYTLTTNVEGQGSVTIDLVRNYYYDSETRAIQANPAIGWLFSHWNGDVADPNSPTTTITFDEDETVEAVFIPITYTITATAGPNGTIAPSGDIIVNYGDDQNFNMTADPGYHIADVLVDSVSVGAVTTYTFTNVTANHTIYVIFEPDVTPTYTITATASTGGIIIPSGAVVVEEGNDQTFTITPNTGYHIADVLVDGASVGTVTTYTFTNVTADHTIHVDFTIITYTITATAGPNGTISPAGSVIVNHGNDQTFNMTADPGYHIAGVLVDSVSVGAVTTYTFTNVTANHTIEATFEPDIILTYTITASASSGGNITPSGAVVVEEGNDQTFNMTADSGYQVANVLVDGASVGVVTTYTFTNITADHAIHTDFTIADNDSDGIPDQEEKGPGGNDPNYDGNNDGMPDWQQNNVASFHSNGHYVTLACPFPLSDVVAIIPSDIPADIEFPYGCFEFTVNGLLVGDTILTLYLPVGANVDTYYKFGPTPNNPIPGWYEFMYDGETGAEINGNIITLHFIDGGRGDDILALDGKIVDQGGPGIQKSGPTPAGSSGGGGCFISTARQ